MLRAAGGIQERFESSIIGRAVISAFVAAIVLFVAVWNLPPGNGGGGGSALRRSVMEVGAPVMYALGLDQNWGVFAPPRMSTIHLIAEIRYSDGSRSTWSPPTSTGALFGAYRDYRWGKYIENVVFYRNPAVDFPLAIRLARQRNSPGHRPVLVTLVEHYYLLKPITRASAPPLPGAPVVGSGPWHTSVVFTTFVLPFMLSSGYVPQVSSVGF